MKEPEFLLLVEYLFKGALMLGIGFLILWPLRRQLAGVKHQVWIGLFAAVIALPLVLAFPRWGLIPSLESLANSAPPTVQAVGTGAPSTREAPVRLETARGREELLSVSPAQLNTLHWGKLFVVAWLTGVLVVVARMGFAWIFLRHLQRRMRPVSLRVREAAGALRDELEIRREVSISISDRVATPFVWGAFSPRVVLPSVAGQWSASELDMVLRHELAHVKRWDAASQLVSRLFLALNWVNPLAWIASRQAMRLREEACDLVVLAGGHRQSDYAALLLSQARLSNRSLLRSATISMAERGTVERRIREILSASGESQTDHRSSRRRHRGTAGLALLAVFLLATFVGLTGVSRAQKEQAVKDEEIAALEEKLDSIIIPSIELKDTPLRDAIAFLQQRSVELDTEEDPNRRGVNFILKGNDEGDNGLIITLKLSNVPLGEAVRYITSLAQREFTVEAHAVIISGQIERASAVVSRTRSLDAEREYSADEKAKITAIEKKLASLVVPSIEFRETPLKAALDFIVQRSKELDTEAAESDTKGINCVLVGDMKEFESTRIRLRLNDAPLGEVLRYTVGLAGMTYEVQPDAVVVAARNEIAGDPDARMPADSKSKPADSVATAEIQKKLKGIIVPSIEFIDTPLTTALEFLQQRSVELDVATKAPDRRGVGVIIDRKGDTGEIPKVTLRLSNVPLGVAIRYTAELAQFGVTVEPHAIVVSRMVEKREKTKVPFQFVSRHSQRLRVKFIEAADGGAFELQRLPSAKWPKKVDPVRVRVGDTCLENQLEVVAFENEKLMVTHIESGRDFAMTPGETTDFDINFAELKSDSGTTHYVREGHEIEMPGSTGKAEWSVVEVLEDQCTIMRESDEERFTLKIDRAR